VEIEPSGRNGSGKTKHIWKPKLSIVNMFKGKAAKGNVYNLRNILKHELKCYPPLVLCVIQYLVFVSFVVKYVEKLYINPRVRRGEGGGGHPV